MDDRLKNFLDKLDTPLEQLELARQRAIVKKRLESKRRKQWVTTCVAFAALCFFLFSIRVSTTFANAVSKVPGLDTIVTLITHNKGIEDVIQHGYNEKIDETKEHAGIKVAIEEVIADETGMFIMYRLSSEQDLYQYRDMGIEVFQNGEKVNAAVTYSTFMNEETHEYSSSIEVASGEGMDYSQPKFEVRFLIKDETIQVPFELKNEIKKTNTYIVNEQLDIEGQKFTVKEIRISPLRVGIEIAVDPANDKRILSFQSLQLLDENNEVWSKISNGFSGMGSDDENTMTHYLQSNYFREPKSLTLKIAEVEALPKGQDFIEIDFEKQKIIFAPDFVDLSKVEIYPMQLRMQYKPANIMHHRQLFGKAVDVTGKELYETSSSVSRMDDTYHEGTVSYDLEGFKNPIKIYFYSYPAFLKGTAEVKIPLQK